MFKRGGCTANNVAYLSMQKIPYAWAPAAFPTVVFPPLFTNGKEVILSGKITTGKPC